MRKIIVAALILCVALTGVAVAKTIKIGAIYPLTGPIASTGLRCKYAVEVALKIINEAHPELKGIPLAETAGLPNLGGAKIKVVFADSQAKPDVGKAEAERLITQEKVIALVGAYQSAVSKPASFVAERYKIPFVCGASSSAALTERGLKYFFRIAPTDATDSVGFLKFLKWLSKKTGKPIKTIGVFYENTEFGKHAALEAKKAAKKMGFKVVADVPYTFGSTNLNAEVQKLKAANPDAILVASLIGDFTLFVKTCKQLDYAPPISLSYCGGFQDPSFIKNVGKDADYWCGSQSFAKDLLPKMPLLAKVNEMFKKLAKGDYDGPTLEITHAVLVLAQAINLAGSTDGDKIRAVLAKTEFPMPLAIAGKVKFGPGGQNIYAETVIQQIQNGKYVTVYPENLASAKLVYPMPAWGKRK